VGERVVVLLPDSEGLTVRSYNPQVWSGNKVLPTVPTEATDSVPQGVTEWLPSISRSRWHAQPLT